MDEPMFWSIIDRAHAEGGIDLDRRCDSLYVQLTKLPIAEIQSFQSHYDVAIKWAYRWDLWGAARIMNGECTIDGFRFFLDWLVSEGRITYQRALESPDTLADLPPMAYAESEIFGYIALHIFESKTAKSLVIDPTVEAWPPAGDTWVEEDLPFLLPRLSTLYKKWDWLQQIRRGAVASDVLRTLLKLGVRQNYDDGFQFDK